MSKVWLITGSSRGLETRELLIVAFSVAPVSISRPQSIRLLTENSKSHNSFLWRQLTASGTSPNTLFLSPLCPQPTCEACGELNRTSQQAGISARAAAAVGNSLGQRPGDFRQTV